jgi:glyoxylase-like metal-dependent hydrolase (beta-lactamase superfamily II)
MIAAKFKWGITMKLGVLLMEYRTFVIGDIRTNCYLVWSGKEAGVIDPGGPVSEVIDFIKQNQLELKWIVNTHGHADHIAGNAALKKEFGALILIHERDREMLLSPTANLSAFMGIGISGPDADKLLRDGDLLNLGPEELQALETPGHSPGGISLYASGLLFSGDALFLESIGRTDLPGGDHQQLLKSIREKLMVLPPETVILPGHEESSTIEHELQYNPYLRNGV